MELNDSNVEYLSARLNDRLKTKKYQLIGLPRSGSTYLADAIDKIIAASIQKPTVLLGEPIQLGSRREISNFYEIIKDESVYVIKHHARQFDCLVDHPGYSRISKLFYNVGLIRNDIFDLSLSLSVAKYTNQYGDYTYTENDKIIVDRHEFINCLYTQVCAWEAFVNRMSYYDEIIYYNDLTFDPVTDFNKMKLATVPFPECVDLMHIKNEYLAPDKTKVVINYRELYDITLCFLEHYINPMIKVTGVNFELR